MLGWSCLGTFPVRLGFQTRKEREKPSNFKRVNCLVTAKFSCTFLGISNLAFMHCGKQTQTKLQENIEEGYSPKESRTIADKRGISTAQRSRCFSLWGLRPPHCYHWWNLFVYVPWSQGHLGGIARWPHLVVVRIYRGTFWSTLRAEPLLSLFWADRRRKKRLCTNLL